MSDFSIGDLVKVRAFGHSGSHLVGYDKMGFICRRDTVDSSWFVVQWLESGYQTPCSQTILEKVSDENI
jgi:hypothetical protein